MLDPSIASAASDPIAALAGRARAAGRPLGVAFTPSFPLEVLDAFGLEGALIPPVQREAYPAADALLQGFTCTHSRSMADVVLGSGLPVGLVAVTSGCDAQVALEGVLVAGGLAAPAVELRLPISVGNPPATRHSVAAIHDFCSRAAAALGRPFDPAALAAACTARQAVRERLSELFAGLANGGSARFAYAAAIASDVMSPGAFLAALDASTPDPVPATGVRVLLSGSAIPSLRAVEDLEAAGAVVAVDDTETGTRGASRHLDASSPDLLDAIGKSLVDGTVHGPVRVQQGHGRIDGVVAAATGARVQAAVLLLYKFCDPHAFEAPAMLAGLRAAGIPGVVIEVDRDAGLAARDLTRVQTLLESTRETARIG